MGKDKADAIDRKKRKKTQRSFLRLMVLILIAAFCVFLYMERGNWISGVENKIDSIRQNDGVLAEGNFPLKVSGTENYQTNILNGHIVILNDSYMYIYSDQGETVDIRQIPYTKAVMKTNGDYSLCFENSGTSFRVDKIDGMVYEKDSEDVIITGAVSRNGYTALITESSTYSCSIYIYDENGKKVYTRNCVERVNEVSFDNEDNGCVFVQMNAEEGEMSSVVRRISFDSEETLWDAPALSTLCLQSSFTDDGRICIIGDRLCAYYNKKGQLESMYAYSGELLSYDVTNGKAAVLVRSDETRETNLLLFNGSAEAPVTVSVNQSSSYVQADSDSVYLLSSDNVVAYSYEGKAFATVGLDYSYEKFIKQGRYLFLMSYEQIDRVDFDE